jgi:hypothetical protein
MKTEFRNRAFLPVVLPLAILLGIATVVALFAFVLLYNTHEAALVLAAVMAAGILMSISLASSRDELDTGRRVAVIGAGALPVVLGLVFASGIVQVDPALLNINTEPHEVIPEDAPVLAAEDATTFCLPTDGGCEPTKEWEVTPSAESEQFVYVFDNRDASTGPHNLALWELAGSEDSPEPGAEILVPSPFDGPAQEGYVVEAEMPETFYFNCTVHPNMNGVGRIVEDEPEA